jgi:solute carrier family 25 carnitine/acylcarnitine transporter 20/29
MDAVQYTSLEFFRSCLAKNKNVSNLNTLQHAIAGFGAGMVVSFVASPIELIKAKLQLQVIL